MIRLALILAIIIAVVTAGGVVAKQLYDAGFHEAQRQAAIEADASRQSTQALIKSVEADYWKQKAASEVQHREDMAALEETIRQEAEDAKTDPAVCRAFISKRVRDQINRLGSDPSGNHP